MKVIFLSDHINKKEGEVISMGDYDANRLIAQGVAKQVTGEEKEVKTAPKRGRRK